MPGNKDILVKLRVATTAGQLTIWNLGQENPLYVTHIYASLKGVSYIGMLLAILDQSYNRQKI